MNIRILCSTIVFFCVVAASGCGQPVADESAVEHTAAAAGPGKAPAGSWPRWGGPNGDFKVAATGLADSWSLEGPPLLWSRPLGEGYSAIAAQGGSLFTMYRDGDDDVAVALDATDGTTRWEHRYPARPRPENVTQFGKGPNASPLLLGDRVVTLGYTGILNCLDVASGELLWSHDLIEDFGGDVLEFGYAASPIEYEGKAGVVAFSPADGDVIWTSVPTSVSYATPIVIDLDGQEQLVYFSADEIIGIDAGDGTSVWSYPVVNQYRNNATGPLWGDDGLLWVATQLDGGTRVLRLSRTEDGTGVEEVWSSNKISIHFWNTVRLGDSVFTSIGSNASILAAVDIGTGKIRWRKRGFKQVNFVQAGDRTILLDANGQLALAKLGPERIDVVSQVQIADGRTWTAPTLVGTTLYVRDRETIRALDLGAAPEPAG